MSKILAISDIHLYDYPQRNPSEKFRLYQGKTVCDNIIEVGQAEGCNIIVIAGDIVEKFLIRPYIQAEVKGFLDNLMDYFDVGYLIYGNHDQDNKGENSEFNDSCLSVMLPANLHYADRREIMIDGARVGFMNWRPTFDLSWFEGKLDIFFTHATINYSPEDQFHSQEIDDTRFDIAFCGDIHKPAQTGKFVSIGIPQRCKMSDSPYATGVVINPGTREWKWVNLNPHDNLMKFEYTDVREEEGWDQGSNTWRVYKPSNQKIQGGVKDITIPAWEEIGHLTDEIISANGLQQVHGEVLQNLRDLDSHEVDFNFTITRFYCKNWRSIDEVELFFGDMDKVLITGENGSGKSSLLSAIKYAFLENPHPKDLIQFGTKECWTEVEFLYQGNNYKIQRGSKKYGFWINGEPQKYNGKRDFEADMHIRFPFIDYMDVYFFDSDHPKLIGDITPERKSEIISRFFKMDRIDAYNDQARILLEHYNRTGSDWKERMDKAMDLGKYIDSRLSMMVLPEETVEQLQEKKRQGEELQARYLRYNDYVNTTSTLLAQKNFLESKLGELNDPMIDTTAFEQRLTEIQGQTSWINEKYRQLLEVKTRGRTAYTNRKDLDVQKKCPACGQLIAPGAHLEEHKAELDQEIQRLLREQERLYSEFNGVGITDIAEINSGCQGYLTGLNNERAQILTAINEAQRIHREIESCRRNLEDVQRKLAEIGPEPEKVSLPANFMEEMARITSGLSLWKQYSRMMEDRQKAIDTINECNAHIEEMSRIVEEYQNYIKITGPTGTIYKEIMTNLAKQFTDNRIKYEVVQTVFRGKDHLNLESSYRLSENEVRYVNCSDGQRTLLDVDFLSKVVTRMGLLIMDEFLKHLDAGNHDIVLDMIGQMNIGLILISSHMESIPAFNNKSLKLELNESGITKISMK